MLGVEQRADDERELLLQLRLVGTDYRNVLFAAEYEFLLCVPDGSRYNGPEPRVQRALFL